MTGVVDDGVLHMTLSSQEALERSVVERLDVLSDDKLPFLIVGSHGEVRSWRRMFAEKHPRFSLGLSVRTFQDHIAERWGLHGDGRLIIDKLTRILYMAHALQDDCEAGGLLPLTHGVVYSLARAVREGMCNPGFADAVLHADKTASPALGVLRRYLEQLQDAGLLEYGTALERITSCEFDNVTAICIGIEHPLPLEEAYLACVDGCSLLHRPTSPEGKEPCGDGALERLVAHLYHPGEALEPISAIRFASASGVYAEPILVTRLIRQYCDAGFEAGQIFVSCADPSRMLEQVGPRLADEGIPSAGRDEEKFPDNLLGRIYLGLRRLFHERTSLDRFAQIALLTDYAASVFSPITSRDAHLLDAEMRKGIDKDADDYVECLSASDDEVAKLLECMASGDDVAALTILYERGKSSGYLDAMQTALVKCAYEKAMALVTASQKLDISEKLLNGILASLTISRPCLMGKDDDATCGRVCFGTLEDLARTQCKVGVVTQLTSESYPLALKGDPLVSLFAEVGIQRPDTVLEDVRNAFARAVSAPDDAIVFERCLCDADSKPIRPSVLFEEIVDCFRKDITATDDLDETFLLPESLLDAICDGVAVHEEEGEEELVGLVPRAYGSESRQRDTRVTEEVPDKQQDERLAAEDVRRLLGGGTDEYVFSASELDAYLACPYYWFLQYKIAPRPLDAIVDPSTYGTFVHKVLCRFYTAFVAGGKRHVDSENLSEALLLLDESFDDVCELEDFGIPLQTELERRQLEEYRPRLHDFLKSDANTLPTFIPTSFEYAFGYGGEVVEYAGHPFKGCMDRIDIDDQGRAFIIDYKGNISSLYSPVQEDGSNPSTSLKVQALIYAQIAKRNLDYDVVGSIYRSYRDASTQGAYDIGKVEAGALPGISEGSAISSSADFDYGVYLDHCEEEVALAIDRLLEGDISKAPSYKQACMYCPAYDCPSRLGGM